MAPAADLRSRVLPDGEIDLDPRRARPAAARQALDEGRRARAPLLLRIRVGRVHRTAGALAPLAHAAADAGVRRAEARRVRRHSRLGRKPRAPRAAAAHAADPARGDRGLRLITALFINSGILGQRTFAEFVRSAFAGDVDGVRVEQTLVTEHLTSPERVMRYALCLPLWP